MDCSLPDSSVHGILHTRILEWVAIPFSRGSSQPGDRTRVSCIAGRFFTVWATKWSSQGCAPHPGGTGEEMPGPWGRGHTRGIPYVAAAWHQRQREGLGAGGVSWDNSVCLSVILGQKSSAVSIHKVEKGTRLSILIKILNKDESPGHHPLHRGLEIKPSVQGRSPSGQSLS